LTVAGLRWSSPAMSGADRPSAVSLRISRSRGVSTGRPLASRIRICAVSPVWISGERNASPRATAATASKIAARSASFER
jgi:hypothetical protein